MSSSLIALSCSLCILAFVQLAIVLVEIGWLQFRMNTFSNSVREVKEARKAALSVNEFYQKKSAPVFLFVALGKAIPQHVLLEELIYGEGKREISLIGVANQQSQVDQFLAALSKEPLFERFSIERVQGEKDEEGKMIYSFVFNGLLKEEQVL